jgi:hypothetical protein
VSDPQTNLQDYVPLLKAWGELRDFAIWGIIILGILIAVCFIIYIYNQSKNTKASLDSKNRRAKAIAESNDRLSDSIESSKEMIIKLSSVVSNNKNINEDMIWPAVNIIKDEISKLSSKVTGTIDQHDALNIIRIVFLKAVYYEIRDHMSDLMFVKEADFKNREQYFADKVRTSIGETLSKYKSFLSNFKLDINYNVFFKLDSTESKERFLLVDIIWSEVNGYLISQLKPEQKYEEISLKLFNIIKDYVNTIISEEFESGQSSGANKLHQESRHQDKYQSSEWNVTKSSANPVLFKSSELFKTDF